MDELTPQSAREDLAYLRALLAPGEDFQRTFGWCYLAAGLCYGGQLIANVAQGFGLLPTTTAANLVFGVGPTVLFLAVLTFILVRAGMKGGLAPGGMSGRVIGAVFRAFGLTNLALIVVIGSVALRQRSMTVWLIYPCCVYVLQGTAWAIAYSLRQRAWLLAVAAGWVFCGLVMAWSVQNIPAYVLAAGIGMIACMVIPGWVTIRLSRRAG
jgi:hypothetical protein